MTTEKEPNGTKNDRGQTMTELEKLMKRKSQDSINENEIKQLRELDEYKSEYIDPGFKDTPMPDVKKAVPKKGLR
jgi:hypothetical protein